MTDLQIAITAALAGLAIMLIAYRILLNELKAESAQRRRWQAIAHEHATHAKRWKRLANGQSLAHERPSHPMCRCVILPGDHTPVSYMSINGELTKPYAIGKSPFSIN